MLYITLHYYIIITSSVDKHQIGFEATANMPNNIIDFVIAYNNNPPISVDKAKIAMCPDVALKQY